MAQVCSKPKKVVPSWRGGVSQQQMLAQGTRWWLRTEDGSSGLETVAQGRRRWLRARDGGLGLKTVVPGWRR